MKRLADRDGFKELSIEVSRIVCKDQPCENDTCSGIKVSDYLY